MYISMQWTGVGIWQVLKNADQILQGGKTNINPKYQKAATQSGAKYPNTTTLEKQILSTTDLTKNDSSDL